MYVGGGIFSVILCILVVDMLIGFFNLEIIIGMFVFYVDKVVVILLEVFIIRIYC